LRASESEACPAAEKYSSETIAQRGGLTRRTLSKVEQGDADVALGIYARVMQVL